MTHKHIYDEDNLCFECDEEKPMNEKQFNLLSERLVKSVIQRKAVKLHMLEGLSAYEAEKRVYGVIKSTVGRDSKRIREAYGFARSIMDDGFCNERAEEALEQIMYCDFRTEAGVGAAREIIRRALKRMA